MSEEEEKAEEAATDAIIQRHVDALREHFDNVQIFATRLLPESTSHAKSKGSGNWYARYGQIREWLVEEEENIRIDARTKASRESE